jgi:acetyl esterase/lipase
MKLIYRFLVIVLFLSINTFSFAQTEVIDIWNGKVPGSIQNDTVKENIIYTKPGAARIRDVTDPTLTVFKPAEGTANGTAIIICPGGGYIRLALKEEGTDVAKLLNQSGITAYVLKYRLPDDLIMKDKSIGPLQDAQESIRIVRRNSAKWGINPNKIGIMGFSAGGHLASSASTHYNDKVYESDSTSSRPDFSILIYPVISMQKDTTHAGSRESLLGKNPSQKLVEHFSNELHVNAKTPPAFIVCAENDKAVPIENSIQYFLALKRFDIPSELHIYEKGGHGFGLAKNGGTESNWPEACIRWMHMNGLF